MAERRWKGTVRQIALLPSPLWFFSETWFLRVSSALHVLQRRKWLGNTLLVCALLPSPPLFPFHRFSLRVYLALKCQHDSFRLSPVF